MRADIMLLGIMLFIDREEALERLGQLLPSPEGQLGVLYGRRRVGKTRLLLEWARRHGGLYTVADQSTPEVQRRYFASVVAQVFAGFDAVTYPDWTALFGRLAREARLAKWRGPLIIDELPYLALASPELPSVLQRFVDHDAREAGVHVVLAGSSQRMMQGLVLAASAPLYGRARVLFELKPISALHLREAFATRSAIKLVEMYAAWGGIPRYWELAADSLGSAIQRLDRLVLDPMGPLHQEPDRLLLEELPPAVELRPILDAIASGAHRVSEIAGRVGRPATSLGRPLSRLQEMGLVHRETPFGESETHGKRSLYRLDDPFVRVWFRVVAPNRGQLATANSRQRLALLEKHWPHLVATAWEELCRELIAEVAPRTTPGRIGPWLPGKRFWHGNMPEWDLVTTASESRRLLLGEAKWSDRAFGRRELEREARALVAKAPPALEAKYADHEVIRALFVPALRKGVPRSIEDVLIVTGNDLLHL